MKVISKIIFLIFLSIKEIIGEGSLLSNEFGLYMTVAQISGWPISKVFSCTQDMFVDRKNQKIFGLIDKNNHGSLKKTYNINQPHWSISVRVDLYFISGMDPSDSVEIIMQGQSIKTYKKGTSATDKFCSSTSDSFFQFYKNITHTASTFDLTFKSQMSSYSYGLSELYVVIDTCFPTCLTCTGPAEDQCQTCFSGSTLAGNKCTCTTGFAHQQACVASCPTGFRAHNDQKICVSDECNTTNCQTCDNAKSLCTACKSGFYLLDGICVAKCPGYTTLSGSKCQDNLPSNGMYLLKALFNNFVGESDTTGAGLVISGFEGEGKGTTATSGALTGICNKIYYIGGFMLAGKQGKIQRSFSGLPYHSQVRVGFTLVAIDDWHYENMKIRFDGKLAFDFYVNFDITDDDLCGVSQFKDKVFQVENKAIHQGSTLNLELQADTAGNSFVASYGIRDLFVSLEKCSEFCIQCDPDKCTKCDNAHYLYKGLCVDPCPTNTFISTRDCIDCHATCATCSGASNYDQVLMSMDMIII